MKTRLKTAMPKSVVMATPAAVDLEPYPEPVASEWILSGTPNAWCKLLVTSDDHTTRITVWECTAGRFHWHFSQDEVLVAISGEAFMINEKGDECRFGAGDVGFFPAGTSCTFRVTERFRKVAVLRESMWRPLGFGLKAWNKFLRMMGRAVDRR